MFRVRLPGIEKPDEIWPRVFASMPPLVLPRVAWQSRCVTRKLSQSYPTNITAALQLGDIFGNRIVEAELPALHGFSERRGREQFPYRAEVEDRVGRYWFVPRQVGKPVIEKLSLTIYAHRYRNATAPAVLRQNRLNILRDNRCNVALPAHWHGSKQSSDQDCKNFRSIHRAILQWPADVGNVVARSRRKTVLLKGYVHHQRNSTPKSA
jgi:hypothetical protein